MADRIRVAFIYGSFARAEETSASDIDVLLIGQLKLDDVAATLGPVHDVVQREINPSVIAPDQYRRRLKSGDAFLRRVLGGAKIFLAGDPDVLEELG